MDPSPLSRFLAQLEDPAECWPLSAAIAAAAPTRWQPGGPLLVVEEHTACSAPPVSGPGLAFGAVPPAPLLADLAQRAAARWTTGEGWLRVSHPLSAGFDTPVSFAWSACPHAAVDGLELWTATSAQACLLEQLPGYFGGQPEVSDVVLVPPAGPTTLLEGLRAVYAAANLVPVVMRLSEGSDASGRPSLSYTSLVRTRASWEIGAVAD
jgi:hypothetical protein